MISLINPYAVAGISLSVLASLGVGVSWGKRIEQGDLLRKIERLEARKDELESERDELSAAALTRTQSVETKIVERVVDRPVVVAGDFSIDYELVELLNYIASGGATEAGRGDDAAMSGDSPVPENHTLRMGITYRPATDSNGD